ncbi:D-alanyl-D-alanine carboxypeptidase/D-alanyl-D-alanine-endopeptidase [Verrucomicrobiaceae bacterium 227]
MRWLFASCCLIRCAIADPVLDRFVGDASLKTASVGVFVIPLEGDEVAMEWQADLGLIPASTLKAITTATALQVLGEEFVFETKLFLKGDDLVVKGGGDPTLGATGLEGDFGVWLAALKAAGVSAITGDIVADASRFEDQTTPNSWPWGDVGNYYGAGPSGLNFHLNSYALTFRPGEVGARAKLVKTWPTPPGVVFANEMRTGSAGSGDQGYVYGGPGATTISVRGTVPAGGDFTIRGSLPDPPLFCALSLKKFLEGNGIAVGGEAKVGKVDVEGLEPLFEQKSPSLKKIITATNHRSVNLYADSLFKALSPEGSSEASTRVLKKHWAEQGVDLTGFELHDGSGLSPRNTVTARQMAMILKKARSHATGEIFQDSLPVAGRSGTMAGFGNGTAAEGKVRAKSGGMTRVKTYAGYLTGKSGREYAFAVFTNNAVASPKVVLERLLSKLVKIK